MEFHLKYLNMDARLVKKIAMLTLLTTLLCTILCCELVAFMGNVQQYLKQRKRLLNLIRLSSNQSYQIFMQIGTLSIRLQESVECG